MSEVFTSFSLSKTRIPRGMGFFVRTQHVILMHSLTYSSRFQLLSRSVKWESHMWLLYVEYVACKMPMPHDACHARLLV